MTTRKTTRSRQFPTTPIVATLATRRAIWVSLAVTVLWSQRLGHMLPLLVEAMLFVVVIALVIWLLTGHRLHQNFVRVLEALHRHLPWFHAASITWMHDDQLADLRVVIARDDVTMHEIDGTTIRSPQELAVALQQHFGSRTFPDDPIGKCITILTKVGDDRQRTHVLLWTNADTMVAADPDGFTRFVAAWTAAMHTSTPRVLLFLTRPRSAAAPHGADPRAAEPRVDAPPEATRPDPAYAPSGAWWRPRPGEVTS